MTLPRVTALAGLLALVAPTAPFATQPPPANTPQVPIFKSGVEFVEVDVVVTDRKGLLVRNLTKNDFQISEDGKPQPVASFALVDIPIEKYDRTIKAGPLIEPDASSNEHAADGRVYVLVLDELHINPRAVQRAKAAARQFIERLGANDLMAVVHTAGPDEGSQEFTSSRRRLLDAVDQTTGHGLESATTVRNQNAIATDGRNSGDTEDLERATHAETTLRVLRDVASWLATVRGRRKAILLISEGIDYTMVMADRPGEPNIPWDVVLNDAHAAIDASMRSNVAIYGVDPSGLTGGDDVAIEYFAPRSGGLGPRAAQRDVRLNQENLRWLSEQTGGIAVVGRNDLGKAYDQIVSDTSAYYVLAYDPPSHAPDGKFHKITVRVNRPGLSTRARSGYLSPKGNAPTPPTRDPGGPSREVRDALASPVPLAGLTTRVSLAAFQGASAPSASVLLIEDLRGQDLKLGLPDTLELSYAAVDATGKVRAGSNDRLQLQAFNPEIRRQIEQSGLRVFDRLNLQPGQYSVRIAAHDEGGGATGSVVYDFEVPDLFTPTVSMSGLVLTSLTTGRMVVAKPDRQMKEVLPALPIAERSFPQNDQIWLFAEIYDRAANTPHTVNIATTVTSDGGTIVYHVDDDHPSTEFMGPHGVLGYRARVTLNDLQPGAYVLTVTARARFSHEETATRQVPITVTAPQERPH